MGRVLLLIAVVPLLFLEVSVSGAQGQTDLTAFDGVWIKNTTKFRNVVYAGTEGSSTVPVNGINEKYAEYTCMEVDPASPDTINLVVYDQYGNYVGVYGYLRWHSGVNADFLGYAEFYSDNGFEYDFAYVTVKYGRFKAVPGYGYYSDGKEFATWDFLWNGKIPGTIPYEIFVTACGWAPREF